MNSSYSGQVAAANAWCGARQTTAVPYCTQCGTPRYYDHGSTSPSDMQQLTQAITGLTTAISSLLVTLNIQQQTVRRSDTDVR